MKYLLLIMALTLVSCSQHEPQFHYGDCVMVDSGFYKGIIGHVVKFYYELDNSIIYSLEDTKSTERMLVKESQIILSGIVHGENICGDKK